jgi:opacity protein-like surface antigen
MKRNYSLMVIPVLVVFLVLASAPKAKAGDAGPLYVGVLGGYVIPGDMETTAGDAKMKNSWMMGAKVGYIIPAFNWLAVEAEYNHMFKQDIDEAGASGDYSADNLMANLLVRYPEGLFHPYAGFGLGCSWGKFKDSTDDETVSAFAWQLMAGLNYEITKNWSADLGYRYFHSKYSKEGADETAKDHMILIGINYHF